MIHLFQEAQFALPAHQRYWLQIQFYTEQQNRGWMTNQARLNFGHGFRSIGDDLRNSSLTSIHSRHELWLAQELVTSAIVDIIRRSGRFGVLVDVESQWISARNKWYWSAGQMGFITGYRGVDCFLNCARLEEPRARTLAWLARFMIATDTLLVPLFPSEFADPRDSNRLYMFQPWRNILGVTVGSYKW